MTSSDRSVARDRSGSQSWKTRGTIRAFVVVAAMLFLSGLGTTAITTSTAVAAVPQYDHVFLIIDENEGYNGVIGNSYAPVMNALAKDYGIATDYRGVADPSEPNYVAMLGGSYFGINNDDPYWFNGNTVNAPNLMSQLESAGKTWRGYFQNMPYPGYAGYCYPDKCNGIPDADTQYVSKHNGIVNFANMQTPAELDKMFPLTQLSTDLAAGTVPNFSYIVPDECDDMHGAPPWCVDSGSTASLQQSWLIANGDKFIREVVNEITSSSIWMTGNDAIVITFDEGNMATSKIATIVITNHGPRGVSDDTPYNHYSLLATLERTFDLGCLLNSCNATVMGPLFAITGSTSIPRLPPPYKFAPTENNVSAEGPGQQAAPVSLNSTGWTVEPSYSFGRMDNDLASVSAASKSDAWAVGAYYPPSSHNVLSTLAEHFDGTRWTAYPLPNVGVEENVLLGVSMPLTEKAWAVGFYVNGSFQQQTLVEHFDGKVWSVVPSPSPGNQQNILYSVAAISDSNVWAVGAQETNGLWHTLTEHWDGSTWSVVKSLDPGSNGNQLYAVTALSSDNVYAVGQQAGTGFPSQALVEHWDGSGWSVVNVPGFASATSLPLGVTATARSLTIVGQKETDTFPYKTYVVAGAPRDLSIQTTPNLTHSENDLFGVTTSSDGTTWTVGWAIHDKAGNHEPIILEGKNGTWSLVSSPSLKGDSGLSAITSIPGGGMWAVGVTTNAAGNYATLIEYHP
jgi:hypothetical protein